MGFPPSSACSRRFLRTFPLPSLSASTRRQKDRGCCRGFSAAWLQCQWTMPATGRKSASPTFTSRLRTGICCWMTAEFVSAPARAKTATARPLIPCSAAPPRAYGQRVIAVLFSGLLDDGTSGLTAVSGRGGITIVQEPSEARFSAMPENALRNDSPRYVLPVQQIAPPWFGWWKAGAASMDKNNPTPK